MAKYDQGGGCACGLHKECMCDLILPDKIMTWDQKYMGLAREVSKWSKDPSSKIGSVAVSKTGQVLSMGYNGFPRGIADSEERLNDRPTKYKLVVHAEMNAIYNASWYGLSLNGATLYVYGLPVCSECAKGIIQAGIKRVVLPKPTVDFERWRESWEFTTMMFEESGVKWEYLVE